MFVQLEVWETPYITSNVSRPSHQLLEQQLNKIGVDVPVLPAIDSNKEIDILIGARDLWKVCFEDEIKRLNDGAVAINTVFGWTIQGDINTWNGNELSVSNLSIEGEDYDFIKGFWDLETFGCKELINEEMSDGIRALEFFEETIKYDGRRYEVNLPWIESGIELNDNYDIAKKRFINLTKKFKSDNKFYEEYKKVIDEQIENKIIEKIPQLQSPEKTSKVYYIPHRAVIKTDRETSKLRIVYDGGSKKNNCLSLNEALFQGPHLVPELLTVLLNFRMHKFAFTADIKQSFLQISIAEKDRDALRFFWIKEGSDLNNPEVEVYRMCRVIFGCKTSPFLLSATIQHHVKKYKDIYPITAELMNKFFYVDDYVCSQETMEKALKVCLEAKEIMKTASMDLGKWKSNCPEIIKQMEGCESLKNSNLTKVLGLTWDQKTDCFLFSAEKILQFIQCNKVTKRTIIQAASRLFDPLGLLTAYTIEAKMLFQELWTSGLGWDDPVPQEILLKWQKWYMQLKEIQNIRLQRWYFQDYEAHEYDLELHVFCDSSSKAYGAIVYIRYSKGENVGTSFVIAKGRIVPIEKEKKLSLTIARKELLATLLGARLIRTISEQFPHAKLYLWTDSLIALHWIVSKQKRWKTFVQNRVNEIHRLISPDSCFHCPGAENPADKVSRGVNIGKLVEDKVYFQGPSWLADKKENWPSQVRLNNNICEFEKQEEIIVCSVIVSKGNNPLLEVEKFSNLGKLLRVTAYVNRFINNVRSNEKLSGYLSNEEISNAKNYWIKVSQMQNFSEDIQNLNKNVSLDNHSKLVKLNPFVDEKGLLRLKSRLVKSVLDVEEVMPIILPNDYFSKLIVIDCHEKLLHAGLLDCIIQLRSQFWVLRARQFVKSVLYNCRVCKRFNVTAGQQVTAPLPSDRIEKAKPFEICGTDFFGPLLLKDNTKAYVAIFSCAITRAIHLEVVTALSTECYILALKRFFGRRGICKTIYSDNAKTFKRADIELNYLYKMCNDQNFVDFVHKVGFEWKFNIPKAPWHGGFYERLISTVKNCLKRILGKSSLNYEQLNTVLVESEAVVNSRPITYLFEDANVVDPLTPSHFLIGSRLTVLPKCEGKVDSSRSDILNKWKHRQALLSQIWNRFYKEYTLQLKTAHYTKNPKNVSEFKINDVVLIHQDKPSRCNWQIGRISEVYFGRDNKLRSVGLTLPNGSFLKRPVQRLYNLEVQ